MQNTGNIPIFMVEGKNIPEAWENAVLKVWDSGVDIKTEYDKIEDLPSKDATVIVTVENPFNEPRIHKNFPGGPEELEVYRQEVCLGIHNSWINPKEKKWTYTYNERLFAYSPCEDLSNSKSPRPFTPVDQIQYIINYLSKQGHSRRAQAITWQPTCDIKTFDPPCLQRIFCRMLNNEKGEPVLNMNTHWRSRDGYKAWFMNVIALTDLQRIIAEKISENINQEVKIGRYVDISDSFHLYGSYFKDIEREVKKMKERPFSQGGKEERTWSSNHPAFSFMTEEAKRKLAEDVDWYKKGKG